MIVFGIVALADFHRSAEGIVTDSATGLQWQDEYGDHDGSIPRLKWIEAIDYCEALTLGGYDDWRLPNIREFDSLVEFSRSSPTIDPLFEHTELCGYWSSTTHADYLGGAWFIDFNSGIRYADNKDSDLCVRCVRSGQ